MLKLKDHVYFVQGSKNGAVYDLKNGDVYSLDQACCGAIHHFEAQFGSSFQSLNPDETEFLRSLEAKGLIDLQKKPEPAVPPRPPFQFKLCWLELTQACNCRCIHCYEGKEHKKTPDALSTAQWLDIIDQITALEVKRIVLIGGEPCLHPDIESIAARAAERGLNTTIFTNGTCIPPQLKKVITETGIRMKFSLYGHTAELHDAITNRAGSFAELTENIKYFLAQGTDVTVAVVLMKENENYRADIADFLQRLGVKRYRFDVIREVFNGTQSMHLPSCEDVMRSAYRNKAQFTKTNERKFQEAFYCNTCWYGKIAICDDGNVIPCVFARNLTIGNVKNTSVKNILNGPEATALWAQDFSTITECRDCEFRYACKDCRPLAMAAKGPFEKNPRCTYDVKNGVWK